MTSTCKQATQQTSASGSRRTARPSTSLARISPLAWVARLLPSRSWRRVSAAPPTRLPRSLPPAFTFPPTPWTTSFASPGVAPLQLPSPLGLPAGTNLPVPATSFVGRTSEIQSVTDLLQTAGVRLVTLLGLAGIGKTRLALEVSRHVGTAFPGGVYFVSLSPVSDPHDVLPEIARALGMRESAYRSPAPLHYCAPGKPPHSARPR